jgi:FkbM family methyltransferase
MTSKNQGSIKEWAAGWFCRHRRGWPWRWAGQLSYLLWRAYENRNFDMRTNGEEWYLRQLGKPAGEIKCVFDVGANVGEWLLLCRRYSPGATIHAFEIAPPTFAKLQKKTGHLPNVVLNPVGVSDRNDEIDVYYSETADGLTTAFKEHLDDAYRVLGDKTLQSRPIRAKVIRGDDYARQHGIQTIDALKIDVEGMEESVLHGFQDMFSRHGIRLVQFEYNTTNIISKFLLRDAHQFFARSDYRLGKLYPNYVEFRNYHYRHEDFCGPNMIAIRNEDRELLKLLDPHS